MSTSLLLRLDALRAAGVLRRPAPGPVVAVVLPAALLLGVLWVAGVAIRPDLATAQSGATLGLLVGAPVGFLAYGVLLRGSDDAFLRRLGMSARARYRERALRLLGVAAGLSTLLTIPFFAAGAPWARPFAVALGAAAAAWGAALASHALAARAMSGHRPGSAWGCLSAGMWDREVAAAAPLVYAPVLPLLAGGVAGVVVAVAPGAAWGRVLALVVASAALATTGERWYAAAMPRFGPQAQEMSFAPPPPAGAGELRVGRGLMRLLPRPAAAVWARDAVLGGRRFGWAMRVVWPVAILCFVALARWGAQPEARQGVAAAAGMVLLLQAAAVIGVGRLERAGRRWVDRAAGISGAHRLLGRWAWGWGMSLWLGVPLALAWGWWAGAGPGWPWLLAGAVTSAVAAAASTAAAGWR